MAIYRTRPNGIRVSLTSHTVTVRGDAGAHTVPMLAAVARAAATGPIRLYASSPGGELDPQLVRAYSRLDAYAEGGCDCAD